MKTKFSKIAWMAIMAGYVAAGLGGNSALGQTYTYTFESTVPQLNGSTITIDGTGNNGVTAFDFDGFTTFGNIIFENIVSYGPSDWTGDFEVSFGGTTYPFAEATGNQSVPDSDTLVVHVNSDILYHDTNTWSGTIPDKVPTSPLFLGTLIPLAALARRLRHVKLRPNEALSCLR